MELKYAEKRRDIRYPFLKTIDYVCNIPADAATYKAVTINLSQSGMCLYMFLSPALMKDMKFPYKIPFLFPDRKGPSDGLTRSRMTFSRLD